MKRPLLIINDHDKMEEVYKRSDEYLNDHDDLQDEIASYLWGYHLLYLLGYCLLATGASRPVN